MLLTVNCPCGNSHTFSTQEIQDYITKLVSENGEDVIVLTGNREYKVSRYYICFHGIKASDLPKLAEQEIIQEVALTHEKES